MTVIGMLRISTLSLLLAGTALSFSQQKSMVHEPAPTFALKGLHQEAVRFSDYKGKVILLDFWATWCTPCQTEVPRFISFQNTYGRQGFQVIGISMDDDVVPVRRFYNRFKINYPVAMGDVKVAAAYGGVLGLPITYLIGRDGRIVKQYDGSADLDQMERDISELLSNAGRH